MLTKIQRRLALAGGLREVGALVWMSFKMFFLKDSELLASTTSAGRLFHRAGAATENARLASSVRVLGTIRRGVLEGLRVRDETWSFSSKFKYGVFSLCI